MDFFQRDKINNGLTQLIDSNPDVDLCQVLQHSDLSMSMRYECPQLIDFLTEPTKLDELLNWALTHEYDKVENSDKITRAAVMCLTTVSKKLQEKLLDCPAFIESLKICLKNDIQKDLQICGHFQRIVELFIQHTNGGFLQHFPNLPSFLIEHANVLALRGLLLRLMTDFADAFQEDNEYSAIALQISKAVNGPNAYFLVTLIRRIIKERKLSLNEFRNSDFISNLMDALVSPPNINHVALFQTECFQVIETIIQDYPEGSKIVQKYESKYDIDANNITCATVSALRIFKNRIKALLPKFFECPGITLLNSLILDRIKEMPDDELIGFIEDTKLTSLVIEAYPNHLINGHLVELGNYLESKKELNSPALTMREWKDFYRGKLKAANVFRVVKKNEVKVEVRRNSIAAWTSFNNKGAKGGILELASACIKQETGKSNFLSKVCDTDVFDEDDDEEEGYANNEDTGNFTLGSLLAPPEEEKNDDDDNGFDPNNLTLGSLLGSQPAAPAPSKLPKLNGGINNKSGHSFTIPTVYQAEVNISPMFC